jgi:glutamate synthase domain-containing protein 3
MIAGEVTTSAQTSANSASTAGRPEVTVGGVPVSFEHALESSHPCPSGGSLALTYNASGTVDEEVGSAVLDVTGSQRHVACAFQHNGITITVDGTPDIDYEAHASILNDQPNAPFTVDVTGSFNWSTSDGRSGTCSITYSDELDFAAQRRTVEGNICGHSFNGSFTWTAS